MDLLGLYKAYLINRGGGFTAPSFLPYTQDELRYLA